MESCKRQHLGKSLSAGQLMRLASQVSQHPAELLSLTAAERMWDPTPDAIIGHYTTPPSLLLGSKKPPTLGSGVPLQRPLGASSSSSSSSQPLRRRMVWCAEEFSPDETQGGYRHDRGVSSCTSQQNSSQQVAAAKLDLSQHINNKKAISRHDAVVLDSPTDRQQKMDMLAAEFNEEVTAMENQMADLGKSLQMNRYSKQEVAAKANEEREAEKRRREAEIRKARLKEKSARDPHRKIQIKLENRRRFEMDNIDQAGIPTTNVNIKGEWGSERMRMVDVQALRSKCQGLTEGIHSVSKLVELQQRKARAAGSMMSTSMPNLGSRFASDSSISRKGSLRRTT